MTVIDRQRLQVNVGGRDVTERVSALTFSAVDAGGFEIASLTLPPADVPAKGAQLAIRQGLEVAWHGRVAENAEHSAHSRGSVTVGCEGYQALLKDNPYSMIYVDRELGQWHGMSIQRRINEVGVNFGIFDPTVKPDATTGAPSVLASISGDWVSPLKPLCEAWYDAGAGNVIGSVYYAWTKGREIEAADAGWEWLAIISSDDILTSTNSSGNLRAAGPGSGTVTGTVSGRFALLQLVYLTTPAGKAGAVFDLFWRPAVYGNHGLSKRGAEPAGFYPSDIARHALGQAKGVSTGAIVDSAGYIAPHVVYRTPTDPGTVINDMAKLMGWTWGVWEPPTVLGSEPRLDFRPPPTDATAVISRAECDQLDITTRLGDLYDTAIVTYNDAAGSSGKVTVELANPQLREAGIAGRALQLSAGLSSKAAAESLGRLALSLSQVAARGAGQATLPRYVRLPGGGSKPACLLRPGNDRLRITDMDRAGSLTDIGTNRRDVFRISRVETTVAADGVPSTRVDLDTGTNLLETLQARLALAAGVIGSGG